MVSVPFPSVTVAIPSPPKVVSAEGRLNVHPYSFSMSSNGEPQYAPIIDMKKFTAPLSPQPPKVVSAEGRLNVHPAPNAPNAFSEREGRLSWVHQNRHTQPEVAPVNVFSPVNIIPSFSDVKPLTKIVSPLFSRFQKQTNPSQGKPSGKMVS